MASNSSKATPKILVDADSCPVKDLILEIAGKMEIAVIFIASISHNISCKGENIQVITVDNVPQAADIAVINNTCQGDIVITGDYGLAALALSKGAVPLSSRGLVFTSKNIDRLLMQRHIDSRIRRGGGRTKGPRGQKTGDRQRFAIVLRKLLDRSIFLEDI